MPAKCDDGNGANGDGCSATCKTEVVAACNSLPKGAASGLYWLDPDGAGGTPKFRCWCDMKRDGGGWTLLMKTDGNSTVFNYDAAWWTNSNAYHPEDASFATKEAKLASFWTLPFKELRLGMVAGGQTRWLKLPYPASSLRSVLSNGQYKASKLGRNAWKSLLVGSSLQANCNREGFNANHFYARVRIGIIANQENDCGSPDSRLGFGGRGSACSQDNNNTCGNTATCTPDNGEKNIKAFGYIFAR